MVGGGTDWLESDGVVRSTPVDAAPASEDGAAWRAVADFCLILVFTACLVGFCYAAVVGLRS